MSPLSVRHVLRDTVAVLVRRPLTFGGLMVVATVPGLAGLSLFGDEVVRATDLISSLLVLYVQLFATVRTLATLGAMPADYRPVDATERRYPGALWASLIASLAVIAGLLLLVVPGVLLLALWGVWMPALLAERLSGSAALQRSWMLVRPRLWPAVRLVLVMLALYVPAAVPMFVADDAQFFWAELAFEPLFAVAAIVSAVMWAVFYCRLRAADPALAAAPPM